MIVDDIYRITNVFRSVKRSTLIFEGIAQGISDTYDEKGIGYCTAFVAGELLQTYIGGKLAAPKTSAFV